MPSEYLSTLHLLISPLCLRATLNSLKCIKFNLPFIKPCLLDLITLSFSNYYFFLDSRLQQPCQQQTNRPTFCLSLLLNFGSCAIFKSADLWTDMSNVLHPKFLSPSLPREEWKILLSLPLPPPQLSLAILITSLLNQIPWALPSLLLLPPLAARSRHLPLCEQ